MKNSLLIFLFLTILGMFILGQLATDTSGNRVFLKANPQTGALITMEYHNHEWIVGKRYYHSSINRVSANDTLVLGITTPDNNDIIHLSWNINGTKQIIGKIFENASFEQQACIPMKNLNFNYLDQSNTKICNLTNYKIGDEIGGELSGGLTSPGNIKTDEGLILKNNEKYILIIYSPVLNDISVTLKWSEHRPIH